MVLLYVLVIAFILYLCIMLIPRSGEIKSFLAKCPRCGHRQYYHRNGTCSVFVDRHMCWCEKEA